MLSVSVVSYIFENIFDAKLHLRVVWKTVYGVVASAKKGIFG